MNDLIRRSEEETRRKRLQPFVYMWEFHGWNQDTSVSDLLSCLREDSLTDVAKISLTEFPHVHEVDQPYRGTTGAPSMKQQYRSSAIGGVPR